MYQDPRRYAFLFQSYVQLTMLQLHTFSTCKPYKVMERSVYSARCFIENMKRNSVLTDVEMKVLETWYHWSIENAHIETDLIGITIFNYQITFNFPHYFRVFNLKYFF